MNTEDRLVSSRFMAQLLGAPHYQMMSLVNKHLGSFEKFGPLVMREEVVETTGGRQLSTLCWFNLDQVRFLVSLTKSTAKTLHVKVKVIKDIYSLLEVEDGAK